MESGLSILSTTMQRRLDQTDVIANNIANSNTTGFKQLETHTYTTFADEIDKQIQDDVARKETALNNVIPKINSYHIDPTAGGLNMTQNELDFALTDPNMMFMIQLPNGDTGYTRDGSFKLNNGILVNGDNLPVLGAGGGNIEVVAGEKPQLGVVTVDYNKIKPQGGNIYVLKENGVDVPQVENPNNFITQGALETSNVNMVKSMTSLITAHRQYEQMSRLMKSIDEINSKAASEVGNTRG